MSETSSGARCRTRTGNDAFASQDFRVPCLPVPPSGRPVLIGYGWWWLVALAGRGRQSAFIWCGRRAVPGAGHRLARAIRGHSLARGSLRMRRHDHAMDNPGARRGDGGFAAAAVRAARIPAPLRRKSFVASPFRHFVAPGRRRTSRRRTMGRATRVDAAGAGRTGAEPPTAPPRLAARSATLWQAVRGSAPAKRSVWQEPVGQSAALHGRRSCAGTEFYNDYRTACSLINAGRSGWC